MAGLQNENVVGFVGICTSPPAVVTEYCPNGSLADVLTRGKLDAVITAQLAWPRRVQMVSSGAAACPQCCTALPAACCLLPAACCPLPAARCPLPAACCLLPACSHCEQLLLASPMQALDAAKGMLYLHTQEPPVIHRDL